MGAKAMRRPVRREWVRRSRGGRFVESGLEEPRGGRSAGAGPPSAWAGRLVKWLTAFSPYWIYGEGHFVRRVPV
ncbi:hypothetical protein GCM10012289_19240 [Nonomuraea cavernae]|uniref:Uncharacterized protein n=1 Tax=Nonomuraea cavernae TaxID=2045107 RepID=A0A918DIG1_9ACTN|nr:hypothetical protein GCM10012289_19240 [Nonomuraea cavernae]